MRIKSAWSQGQSEWKDCILVSHSLEWESQEWSVMGGYPYETKIYIIYSTILLPRVTSSAILESITTHMHAFP